MSTALEVLIACLKRFWQSASSPERPPKPCVLHAAVYESVEYERATVNPVLEVRSLSVCEGEANGR